MTYEEARQQYFDTIRQGEIQRLGEQALKEREEEAMYQAVLKRLIRDGYVTPPLIHTGLCATCGSDKTIPTPHGEVLCINGHLGKPRKVSE